MGWGTQGLIPLQSVCCEPFSAHGEHPRVGLQKSPLVIIIQNHAAAEPDARVTQGRQPSPCRRQKRGRLLSSGDKGTCGDWGIMAPGSASQTVSPTWASWVPETLTLLCPSVLFHPRVQAAAAHRDCLFPSTVRTVPVTVPVTETLELVPKGKIWSLLRLRARDTPSHSHDITLGPGNPRVLGLSLHRDHVDMLSHCPNPLLYAQHRPVVPEISEDPTPGPKRG